MPYAQRETLSAEYHANAVKSRCRGLTSSD
jgi:hypothetical protein